MGLEGRGLGAGEGQDWEAVRWPPRCAVMGSGSPAAGGLFLGSVQLPRAGAEAVGGLREGRRAEGCKGRVGALRGRREVRPRA